MAEELTIEQLEVMGVNAMRAGDEDAARKIANVIKQRQAQTNPQPTEPEKGFVEGAVDFAKGVPGAIPAILSGAVAEPVAGLAGIAAAVNPFADEGAGARTIETVRGALTIDPVGSAAQQTLQTVGKTLEPITEIPGKVGEAVFETTNSPMLATAAETTVAAIPEVVGLKGGRSLARPSRVSRAVPEADTIRAARQASDATGIDLFDAQQTLNVPQLERQAFVQQLPAGAQRASQALARQNQQASQAVDNVLATIAPDDAIVAGQERFRSAAQRAIEARRQIRAERSSPLYQQAFEEARRSGRPIDTSDIRATFSTIAEDFAPSGSIRRTMEKAIGFLETSDLRKLHNAKLEIDDMITRRGDDALGNTARRQLTDLKERLVARMAEESPLYDQARIAFRDSSPDIVALEESIIGKVANLRDTQLKSISRQIFDPEQSNVRVVRDAREVINSVDPGAWNMLLRGEMERRLGRLDLDNTELVTNLPGSLQRALFGTGKQKNVLMAGADPVTRRSLENLDVALKRAAQGRAKGSQTATRTEIANELKGGVVSGLRDLFTSPIDTIVRGGENAQFNSRVAALSEALFDPTYRAQTERLISTGKGRDLTQLVLKIEALKEASRGETEEEPQETTRFPTER